jgi:TrmH family RNA methyltransferase
MLDNPRSPKVRAVAKLAQKQRRMEAGMFLVEGPQAIREALAHRPELVVDVFLTPGAKDRYSDIVQLASSEGIELSLATDAVVDHMADTVTPQGIVAVCQFHSVELETILATVATHLVILHEVKDPGNLGNIIRTADAAGANAVIITGDSVDVFNPKVVRASTGSIFHIPLVTKADLSVTISQLKDAGIRVLAADARGRDLVELRSAGELAKPVAWMLGNEAHGLSDEAEALADVVVSVPIYGTAESLSLPTAAAVCIYETAFAQKA